MVRLLHCSLPAKSLCGGVGGVGGFCPVQRADPGWGWTAGVGQSLEQESLGTASSLLALPPTPDGGDEPGGVRIQHCPRAQPSMFTGSEEKQGSEPEAWNGASVS